MASACHVGGAEATPKGPVGKRGSVDRRVGFVFKTTGLANLHAHRLGVIVAQCAPEGPSSAGATGVLTDQILKIVVFRQVDLDMFCNP